MIETSPGFEPYLGVNSEPTSGGVKEGLFGLPPTSIVYWARLGLAVLAGAVYNALGLGLQGVLLGTLAAIGIGILFYAASVFLVKNVLRYGEAELKGPRKHVSLGWGTYTIWLIFTIVLLNTILYARP
ncbi:hypothetical protein E6H36_10375 [Candidatus Bathyarchaeota archaeon]|nr:MAG: hypothetical protein AUJ07_00835 [Crenarchaeota archaeon 13_1_40CM_3_53_5]TMI23495.1 MAG: hypothetical protein E6H36_10375 [Candidatus Bathyarchaeota archaeon]